MSYNLTFELLGACTNTNTILLQEKGNWDWDT